MIELQMQQSTIVWKQSNEGKKIDYFIFLFDFIELDVGKLRQT